MTIPCAVQFVLAIICITFGSFAYGIFVGWWLHDGKDH